MTLESFCGCIVSWHSSKIFMNCTIFFLFCFWDICPKMFEFFLWPIYIEKINTFWHKKLHMNTLWILYEFCLNLWTQNVLIPPSPKLCQGAEFPNAPILYTTYIHFFKKYKILKAIVGLFFSSIFQSFFPDWYFILFQLYLFLKGLFFDILSIFVLILNNIIWLLRRIESIYHHLW